MCTQNIPCLNVTHDTDERTWSNNLSAVLRYR